MKRRILILEKSSKASHRLRRAFDHAEVESVLQARTMREACEALGRERYDLVVIPPDHAEHQVNVFRAIQPGVPIAVSGRPDDMPQNLKPLVQAIVDTSREQVSISVLKPPPTARQRVRSATPAMSPVAAASDIGGKAVQAGRAPAEEWPLAPAKAAATVAGRQSTSALHRESLWEPIFGLLAFVIPRLLFAALILIFIIFFTYLGLDMAGGTDFWTALREAVPNTVAYLGRLMQGDLGMTTTASGTARPVPIAEVLAIWLPRSLGLLAISLIFASVVGVLLGVRAATRGAAHSLTIIVATIVGVSVPSFFAAFLLQWLVINATQMAGRTLLPAGGFGWDSHLILPGLVLAARPLAQITRITFVSVGDVLREDFVRTARSKGLRGHQVMFQHVMRNAAIPILTTMGVSLRFALTTLPIVEFYFGWLGAGYLLLKSIGQQDEELTIALVLCLGLLFIIVNFILEVSYRFLDPRLRTRPAHVAAGRPQSLFESLRSAWSDLGDLLTDNPIANWIKRRNGPPVESPFRAALERVGIDVDADDTLVPGAGRTVRRLLGNVPLVVGGLLVLVLLVVFVFGPNLAPNSPFTTLGLQKIDGQLTPPPFPPGEQFPWGTDALGRGVLSLVLAGARQTLTLAAVAVVARMFVGIFLGAIAGWTNGSRLDRVIVGAAEIIAAYPTLLLAMIIILAIGIRQGMMPFIIALTMVGWGETMQYVRSEVMSIRPKPFIESAVAIGARTPRIIGRHILPILFSSLISIGALEMGSVLMLLGELGFINIFIGGGSLIELPTETILYSDVPEWGALLSNVRYYAHGYPWTAMYPMLALFVAVLAFNLFGEGIRRLVAQGHLVINRFFNRYTLALAIVAVVGLIWLRQNMGAMPYYRDFAKEFDGQEAMAYVTELTEPTMDGRSLGTPGMDKAADYIADEMVRLGLQAGGQKNTLFQERRRSYEMLDATPVFTIDDGGPEPEYGQDFAVYPSQSASLGQVAKPVRFIGLGQVSAYQGAVWRVVYPDLERVDFSNDIVLVLSDREAAVMEYRADGGLLIVTDDPDKLSQSYTLGSLYFGQPAPKLWISEEMADRLLAPSGHTVAELREQVDRLPAEAVIDIPLETRASIDISGTIDDDLTVRNVIGLLPGTSGKERCTICLGVELVVVMAQYDSPAASLVGPVSAAANDNASGVAVMLEALRVMQETDYQPYRSFLFVAYSGEGLDGGAIVSDPDVNRFLQAKTGFTEFQLEAIVQLRGLGGGSGDRLQVSSGGSLRLADLFESSARQMGVRSVRADEAIDLGVVFEGSTTGGESVQKAPVVRLQWEGWEENSRLPTDTVENISADDLEEAGRALAMALMILGREQNY